jgi:hypothetical protein
LFCFSSWQNLFLLLFALFFFISFWFVFCQTNGVRELEISFTPIHATYVLFGEKKKKHDTLIHSKHQIGHDSCTVPVISKSATLPSRPPCVFFSVSPPPYKAVPSAIAHNALTQPSTSQI